LHYFQKVSGSKTNEAIIEGKKKKLIKMLAVIIRQNNNKLKVKGDENEFNQDLNNLPKK